MVFQKKFLKSVGYLTLKKTLYECLTPEDRSTVVEWEEDNSSS